MATKVSTKEKGERLWIRSLTGSDYHFPTLIPNAVKVNLTAPFDKWEYMPNEWEDNLYVQTALEKEQVEIVKSKLAPDPVIEIPDSLENADREFVRAVLFGPFTDQIKANFEGLRNKKETRSNPTRAQRLTDRYAPMIRVLMQLEQKSRNRPEVVSECKSVLQFVEKQEWNILDL